MQTTHPGTIQLDGDTATGRASIHELARTRDGRQGLNYAIYHDPGDQRRIRSQIRSEWLLAASGPSVT